jgi:hypothetical protein
VNWDVDSVQLSGIADSSAEALGGRGAGIQKTGLISAKDQIDLIRDFLRKSTTFVARLAFPFLHG